MGTNAVTDIPEGFQVVSESDIPAGFQIAHHPGIDFGEAMKSAGKSAINPSPSDMLNGLGPAERAASAGLQSVYGQGKEALTSMVPKDFRETVGKGVTGTFLGPAQGLVPSTINRLVGNAGVGTGVDIGSGLATEGVGPVAKGLSKVSHAISEGAEGSAGRIINQYLKPREAQFSFGKNPGKEIADQGITAWTRGGLKNKVGQRLSELSSNLENIVNQHEANGKTKVDMRPALQTIASKIQELSQLPETADEARTKLQGFGRDMIGLIGDNPESVNPANALKIKRLIGKIQSWAQKDPTFGTISDAARDMYHPVDAAMDEAMPETKDLNGSISSLIGAQTALEKGVAREQNKSFVGLFDRLGIPGIAGMLGFSQGGTPEAALAGGATLAAQKIASSAAGRTNIAKVLSNTGKGAEEASQILENVKGPQIINRIMELFSPQESEGASQGLLSDTKQLEFPKGRGNFKGSSSGPTINGNGPEKRIQIPQVLETDMRALAEKYGAPERNLRSVVSESDIPKGVGRVPDKPGLIQSKKMRDMVDKVLRKRKVNFGD